MSNEDERTKEILDLADAEGIVLPLPVKMILELEDAGYVIDLATGDIVGVNDSWFTLTPEAELAYWWLLPEITGQP